MDGCFCHILFRKTSTWTENGEEKSRTKELLTGKRFNGRPSVIVGRLQDFWDWTNRKHDFGYVTANWFYYCKSKYEIENRDEIMAGNLGKDHKVPHVRKRYSIHPDNAINVDIRHFYVVDLSKEKIEYYTADGFEGVERKFEDLDKGISPDEVYDLNPDKEEETKEVAQ